MTPHQSLSDPQPEFEGTLVTSPVDGSKVKWPDGRRQLKANLCSQVGGGKSCLFDAGLEVGLGGDGGVIMAIPF